MRHFPEGFYAGRCLRQMGIAPPFVREPEPPPLASARLDPGILADLYCPNSDSPWPAAPILLIRLRAHA